MEPLYRFDDAVFTYAISEDEFPLFSKHLPLFGGKYTLHYTSNTQVIPFRSGAGELTVIGLCVDSHGEMAREEIPQYLLGNGDDIETIYRRSSRMAGKFVVCCQTAEGNYFFGDATGSLEGNYTRAGEALCISSGSQLAASHCGYEVSPRSVKIRNGSNYDQGLPNCLTLYKEIQILLPNHYLDIDRRKATRVLMKISPEKTAESVQAVMDTTISLVEHTLKAYRNSYTLVCPLTSGYDSRAVLSFLKDADPNILCYTFLHSGFTDKTDDVAVPRQICQQYGLQHLLIPDLEAPQEYAEAAARVIGPFQSRGTVNLAYTYLSRFQGKALVNGDIIDQIGKSLLGNALPERFATARYFQCKLHNTEPLTRQELQAYLREIKESGETSCRYDLFAIENRCGRWAAQGGTIYSLLGIPSLNLFNCRELIQLWMGLDRRLRVSHAVHQSIFSRKDPQLMSIPFNPSSRNDILKRNWLLFLLATYAKFAVSQLRRKAP